MVASGMHHSLDRVKTSVTVVKIKD